MQKITFDTPVLFGDHHVLEVRSILLALPGITEVYASSSFHIIEVNFDPAQITAEQITACLESTGYLSNSPGFTGETSPAPMRRTATFSQTPLVVSFTQDVKP